VDGHGDLSGGQHVCNFDSIGKFNDITIDSEKSRPKVTDSANQLWDSNPVDSTAHSQNPR
jgi:hypothetical protein